MNMQINYAGKVPLSTVDWFGKAALVLFLNGCPLHCPNCHNAQLRERESFVSSAWLQDEISSIRQFLNHMVLSGGEPLAQPAACRMLIDYCHEVGYEIALETSGCYPLVEGFDRVFLDIKTSLERGLYDSWTGFPGSFDSLMSNLARMDPKTSEARLVLYPSSNYDLNTLAALRGFPIRISIGNCLGMLSQEGLREFGFALYDRFGYRRATIEAGRMFICP